MSNNDDGAREALVERLAETYERVTVDLGYHDRPSPQMVARAVAPLVAAQVEAAVSVVRAEVERELTDADTHAGEWMAKYRSLREKVARVEALRDEWVAWTPGVVVAPSALASAYERGIQACVESLTTALSEPTTPDQEGGA